VLLAWVTPARAPAVIRSQLATELVADGRHLEQQIADVEARIKTAVAQANTSSLGLFGVGPVLAARFLGEVGDMRRFPTKHHFAARGLQRGGVRSSATGCPGPGTASSITHLPLLTGRSALLSAQAIAACHP
jgi:transposase